MANFGSWGLSAASIYSGLNTTNSVSVPLPENSKVVFSESPLRVTSVDCSKFSSIKKNMIGSSVARNQSREPFKPADDSREERKDYANEQN
jgi:hypothetical protein